MTAGMTAVAFYQNFGGYTFTTEFLGVDGACTWCLQQRKNGYLKVWCVAEIIQMPAPEGGIEFVAVPVAQSPDWQVADNDAW